MIRARLPRRLAGAWRALRGLGSSFATGSIFSLGGAGSTFTSAKRRAHSLDDELIGVNSAFLVLSAVVGRKAVVGRDDVARPQGRIVAGFDAREAEAVLAVAGAAIE